ncbi:MAG: hypothetical protein ABS75_29700 [Pelagibacterium sp. SCN 63-23]|nr:MAG: hypothetical protein ABS75_29700 [Pelagibacterium sp. SCN 63-23]
MIRNAAILAFTLALTAPALAGPNCYISAPGARISFGVSVGGIYTTEEKNQFNLMRLRQMGVDASSSEMWDGCIRAFVRKPGGGEEMQFFDPDTFERVY